ncbi:hypothetical protein NHX12_015071, partial [Muraenolepis orangiensis]
MRVCPGLQAAALALFVACVVTMVVSVGCTAAPRGTEEEDPHPHPPGDQGGPPPHPPQETCASCGIAEPGDAAANVDLLEAVKRHILSRLQMRDRPNITTHPVPKAAMVTALRKLHAGRVLADGRLEIPNLDGHATGGDRALEESSEIISFAETDDLVTSKSSLFFLISNEGNHHLVTVKVYYQEPGLGSRWNLVEKRVELKRSGWHTFQLTEAVRLVFGAGGRRQNLDVRCDGCAAEAFYIDFRLIGWSDWIIAPAGYYGNYCEGRCPAYMAGVPGSASSFHTAVVNQYRMRGMSPGSMNSCCIPTRLSTMSMLYFDDEYNIVKRDVPNMIVEEHVVYRNDQGPQSYPSR